MKQQNHTKPLEGLIVVAIEQAVAAPMSTCRLADMGARVIKIERAEGDFARGYDKAANGEASYFVWANRGKESIVLDFKKHEDAALLERILSEADVFVQNLAPNALERAGFGSEELRKRHPKLITCDISGYGGDGPAAKLKAYDLLVQCESGLAGISGAPEAYGRIGVSICDIGAGMNATIGILSALALRSKTGKGSGVAVSLFDGAADWMTVPYVHEVYGTGSPGRMGLRHPSIAPYGAYSTRDSKDIVISIQNEREWQRFCQMFLHMPDVANDPKFSSNTERVCHMNELDELIGQTFAQLTANEALARLDASNTAYGQVRSVAEMAVHPALRTWPMQINDHDLNLIAPPVQTPWDDLRFAPAPKTGQHTDQIRAEFSSEKAGARA